MTTTVTKTLKKNLPGRAERTRKSEANLAQQPRRLQVPIMLTNTRLQRRWHPLACSPCSQIAWCLIPWQMAEWCHPITPPECPSQAPLTLPLTAGHCIPHSFIRMPSIQQPLLDLACRSQALSITGLDIPRGIPWDRWGRWVSLHSRRITLLSACLEGCHSSMGCQVQVLIWSWITEKMTWTVLTRRSKPNKWHHSKQFLSQLQVGCAFN